MPLNTTIFTSNGDIPILIQNDKLVTKELLNIAKTVVIVIENFGSIYAPIVHDLNGNIKKITIKYEEDEDKYKYVEDMVLLAKENRQIVVIDALKWLRRSLHLISNFFKLIINDTENSLNLKPFIETAYKDTLQIYHGWLEKQLFKIIAKCVPDRQQLFHILALKQDGGEKYVLEDMKVFTERLNNCVEKLIIFYLQHDLED